jgi:hypothetical protein
MRQAQLERLIPAAEQGSPSSGTGCENWNFTNRIDPHCR